MTDIDVIDYLASKGYRGRDTSGAETTFPCFLGCDEPSSSTKRKLYVNRTTGMYHCKVCEAHGGTTLLQRHFGDEQRAYAGPVIGRRSAVLESVVRRGEQLLREHDEVMLRLVGPGRWLPVEVIENRRLGYIDSSSLIDALPLGEFSGVDIESAGILYRSGSYAGQDFFRNVILIPYIERGCITQVRGKSLRDGRYYTGPGEKVHLYNADALAGAEEVLLVEGEFDAMVLADLLAHSPDMRLRSLAVLGLPGVQSLPEDFEERLAAAKRIYIGTDPDEAGRRGAVKIRERLGHRAHILDYPDELLRKVEVDGGDLKELDWTSWIGRYGATWRDVLVMLRASSRLSSMAEAGSRYRSKPGSGLKLGYAELDAWFHPGLQPGNLLVILAKTGVGKTLILCNIAYHLCHRKVLFITLEQTQEEVYERLARIYRFYRPAASDEDIEIAFADLRICDENRLTEADFAQLISEYTEEVGQRPDAVFVDYLGYYAHAFSGGRYEKVSDAVMQLKAEAKKHRVAIIAPHQVNRMGQAGKPLDADDARDSGVVEETADFLLGVYRPDDALDVNATGMPTGRLKCEVLKSRRGHKGKVTTFQMGLLSLAIVDSANTTAAKAATNECYEAWRGLTYEDHLAGRQPRPVQMQLR